jgi:hypothetical protein
MLQKGAATIVSTMTDIHELSVDIGAVEGKNIGDAEVLALLRYSGLRRVSLAGCDGITDKALEGLSKLAFLEDLDLSFCNQITDRGIRYISSLPRLRVLNLNWCYSVGDAGMEDLCKCETLEIISLWSCEEITDAGVISLSRLQQLKKLDLPEFAPITNLGVAGLAKNTSSLTELRLSNLAELTDDGLTSLAICKTLRTLIVEECPKVTVTGIAALGLALPHCQIVYK